ncbi:MAG: phage major capsid protein [Pirellulaceae bacterium]
MSTDTISEPNQRPVADAGYANDPVRYGRQIAYLLENQQGRSASETLAMIRRVSPNLTMCDFARGLHHLHSSTIIEKHMAGRAALSSVSGVDALMALLNVAIVAGAEAEPDTTEGWTRVVPLPNFQDATFVTNDSVPRPGRLGRGDTAPHVSMTMSSDSWRLSRFAAMLVLDEQDLADTMHFDLFTDLVMQIGRGFARINADAVYSLLLQNPTTSDNVATFHATHGNLETAALAITALQTCRANIAGVVLQDDSGRPQHINLDPRFLIVPPDLADSARIIARSITDGVNTTVVRGGSDIIVRSESRLGTAGVVDPNTGDVYTGTATNYLLAAPASQRPCVLIGALNGQVTPTVSRFKLDQGQWGMGVAINLDLAVSVADYRGLCWSTGAA